MQSAEPLKGFSDDEALDTLARLYKTYVDPRTNEGRIRAALERMTEPEEIQATLLDIGKHLALAEKGLTFATAQASTKSLLANAGQSVLNRFFFHASNLDAVINYHHNAQTNAENAVNACFIQKAVLDADVRSFRKACKTPFFKEISRPVIEGFFGVSGSEAPTIDPASLPPEDFLPVNLARPTNTAEDGPSAGP